MGFQNCREIQIEELSHFSRPAVGVLIPTSELVGSFRTPMLTQGHVKVVDVIKMNYFRFVRMGIVIEILRKLSILDTVACSVAVINR